jgi:hypothetical protein
VCIEPASSSAQESTHNGEMRGPREIPKRADRVTEKVSDDHPYIWRYTARRALVIFDHPSAESARVTSRMVDRGRAPRSTSSGCRQACQAIGPTGPAWRGMLMFPRRWCC